MRTLFPRHLLLILLVTIFAFSLSACDFTITGSPSGSTSQTPEITNPSTQPGTQASDSIVDASNPTTSPSKPAADPTEPAADPTEPAADPTEPATDPTEPATDPTEPATDSTEPATDPTEPATDPTEPATDPTEPATEPDEPANPGQVTETYPNGIISKKIYYREDGSIGCIIEYDTDGNMTIETNYRDDGSGEKDTVFTYYPSGQVKSCTRYTYDSTLIYYYDEDDFKTYESVKYNNGIWWSIEFARDGSSRTVGGTADSSYVTTKNAAGESETTTKRSDGLTEINRKNAQGETTYSALYDADGNLLNYTEVIQEADGSYQVHTHYTDYLEIRYYDGIGADWYMYEQFGADGTLRSKAQRLEDGSLCHTDYGDNGYYSESFTKDGMLIKFVSHGVDGSMFIELYDAHGRAISHTAYDAAGQQTQATQYEYAADGSKKRTTVYADGSKQVECYNATGALLSLELYDASDFLYLKIQHQDDGSRISTSYQSDGTYTVGYTPAGCDSSKKDITYYPNGSHKIALIADNGVLYSAILYGADGSETALVESVLQPDGSYIVTDYSWYDDGSYIVRHYAADGTLQETHYYAADGTMMS